MSPCDSLPDVQYCIAPMKHGNVEACVQKIQEANTAGVIERLKTH